MPKDFPKSRLTKNQMKVLAYLVGRDWTFQWRVMLYANVKPSTFGRMVEQGLIQKKSVPDRDYPGKTISCLRATKKGGVTWREIEKPLKIISLAHEMKLIMGNKKVRHRRKAWPGDTLEI